MIQIILEASMLFLIMYGLSFGLIWLHYEIVEIIKKRIKIKRMNALQKFREDEEHKDFFKNKCELQECDNPLPDDYKITFSQKVCHECLRQIGEQLLSKKQGHGQSPTSGQSSNHDQK